MKTTTFQNPHNQTRSNLVSGAAGGTQPSTSMPHSSALTNGGAALLNLGHSPMHNILTYEPNLICGIKDHYNDKIDFICTHPQCNADTRLCCSYCQYRFHSGHLGSTVKIKDFTFKTLKDADNLQRNLEQLNHSGDISQVFQQRLEQTIRARIDENIRLFNRYMQEQQEQLNQFVYQYSFLYGSEHSNLNHEIQSFNDNLNQILHQPWRSQTKEDVEVLVKIFRNPNAYGEFLGDADIQQNTYFRTMQERLDSFYSEVNFMLGRVIEETTLKMKEIQVHYLKNNVGRPLPQSSAVKRSRSNQNGYSGTNALVASGAGAVATESNLNTINRTMAIRGGMSLDKSTPLISRKLNNTNYQNSRYEPSINNSYGGGLRRSSRSTTKIPYLNSVVNGSSLYETPIQTSNANFLESSILAEHPDDQNSMYMIDTHPHNNSNMRILPSLTSNGFDDQTQYGKLNNSSPYLHGFNNSGIIRRNHFGDYNPNPEPLVTKKENPNDSSILVIGFDHIASRNNQPVMQPPVPAVINNNIVAAATSSGTPVSYSGNNSAISNVTPVTQYATQYNSKVDQNANNAYNPSMYSGSADKNKNDGNATNNKFAEDLNNYMKKNGTNTSAVIKNMLNKEGMVEADDSHKITRALCAQLIKQLVSPDMSQNDIEGIVEQLDLDKDGYVDRYDLEQFLNQYNSLNNNSSNGNSGGSFNNNLRGNRIADGIANYMKVNNVKPNELVNNLYKQQGVINEDPKRVRTNLFSRLLQKHVIPDMSAPDIEENLSKTDLDLDRDGTIDKFDLENYLYKLYNNANPGSTLVRVSEKETTQIGLNQSSPSTLWKDYNGAVDSQINEALLSKVEASYGNFKHKSNKTYEPEQRLQRKGLQIKDGVIHDGTWIDQSREGYGICYLLDGSRYQGNWEKDQAHGWGRVIHPNGNVFEGEWKNGRVNGQGVYNYTNGTFYDGYWVDDQYHGVGTKTWINGSKYEGQYQNGARDGRGKFIWPDGSMYQGEFRQNQINGRGVYKWNDGRIYTGDWKDGKMNGQGIFEWADGRHYQGEYVDDQKEGFGTFTWPGGEKQYEGAWKNDQPHGIGIVSDKSGVKQKGEWVEGKNIQWFDSL